MKFSVGIRRWPFALSFYFFFPQYDHFPTDSWQLFNYCTVARFCGSVVYPGRQDLHRQRYQHQRRERKKEPTNYSLIIKNACAHRINPNASNCPALRSLDAVNCISMQHQHCELNRNWLGEAAGDGAGAGTGSRYWWYWLQFIRVSLTSPAVVILYGQRQLLAVW